MNLDNLIGNDNIKSILKKSIKKNNILHSYLFYGIDGIGKKLFAFEFAKMILCDNKINKPCGNCKSCIEFDTKNNPDFFLIEPDGNTIKIDQIRQMQKNILEKPINGSKKVYIIDNADTMTKEAQNCLLKTLEEPQAFIVIILIASNENNILATVKSRCTKMYFHKLTDANLKAFLNEKFNNVNLDENMLKLCDGSISKSIKVIEKISILNQIKSIVDAFDITDELNIINQNEVFYNNKEDINLLLDYMYVLLFEKINHNIVTKNHYINAMELVQEAKNKLSIANNYDMTIDNMLIKIWGEINEENYRGKI
ncbi:MAG: DNA polymerase III subunit delta' [Clostridia bacterium]|nr:DNA polymerase III subunit delta' [Clostridia bacterium]